MDNLDDLLKSDYKANIGNVLQEILGRTIAGNLLTSEVLRRVIILEKEQKGIAIDDDEVHSAISEVTNIIAEQATNQVRSLVANWHLKSDD